MINLSIIYSPQLTKQGGVRPTQLEPPHILLIQYSNGFFKRYTPHQKIRYALVNLIPFDKVVYGALNFREKRDPRPFAP